jgi:hypothetical protein
MLFILFACNWGQGNDTGHVSDDTGTDDSGENDDTGLETGETGKETGETGKETGETGNDDSGGPPGPELTLSIDPDVVTMVHAIWTESKDDASLEYRFEGKTWLPAPAIEPGQGVILGIPERRPSRSASSRRSPMLPSTATWRASRPDRFRAR